MISPQRSIQLTPQVSENPEKYRNSGGNERKSFPKNGNHQLMDLKIDYAFKQLFGDERNKEITIAFLNAFFAKSEQAPIQKLEFRNVEREGSKNARMKMLVETADKKRINVEIQFTNQDAAEIQSLFYLTQMYRQQFDGSSGFNECNPVITINIMNFELSHENAAFHSIYSPTDAEGKITLTNMLESHFVEIPKFIRDWEQEQLNPEEDALTRWLLLLAAVDGSESYFYDDIFQELEKIAAMDQDIAAVMKAWKDMSSTEENRLIYRNRLKKIREQQSILQELEIMEQRRNIAEEKMEIVKQKYEELKKQYEQQSIKTAEEQLKRLEAEEKSVLANREAAKTIIRYGRVVARNLFEQGMDSSFVKNMTGLSEKEVTILKQELEENSNNFS